MKAPRTHTHRRSRRHQPGFTLLEMILALAIFVGSAAALSKLVLIGIENAEYSRWQTEAALITENRFQELDAGILTLDDAGTFTDPEFPQWECTIEVAPADLTGLYLVTVQTRNLEKVSLRDFTFQLSKFYLDESELETEETAEP